ncbi:MAG: hypothetical protein QF903_09100 [Planctomycetota bacterium]|jgi:hypothetical protein|nr:hypothetical protein [Planctomycetota bacterium]MDP6763450.1 hypothetical protein [Planctomycetota bacterium]MDP6989622.1 hypothetical protein [Planctomycetota bacterium]
MSPIGRIFSVINLVLAAFFLAWAANLLAVSQEFKTKYDDEVAAHAATKSELDGTIVDLRSQVDTARNDADLARGERDSAQQAARLQEKAADDQQSENATLQSNYDKIANSVANLEANNRGLQAAKDTAVSAQHDAETERDAAQRDQQAAESRTSEVEALNDSLHKTIGDKDAAIASLGAEISNLEVQLATLVDVTGVAISDITSQPLIEGTVVKALYDIAPGMVALNVGSASGVVRGHTFEIHNGTSYKGQVRVENVRADMCTAIVHLTVPGQTISQGDSAKTRL